MNKLLLIIKREYISRVTSKSFILTTLLTPLAIVLFTAVVTLIFSYETDEVQNIAVIDEAKILDGSIRDEENLFFHFEKKSLEEVLSGIEKSSYSGVLYVPAIKEVMEKQYTVFYYAAKQPGLSIQFKMKDRVEEALRDFKIVQLNLDKEQIAALDTKIILEPEPISKDEVDSSRLTSAIAAIIGMSMGFIMYMTVFIYGMMVMRSVMEEKMNRIVEVMISSVKPFQLMLGKIIGVGGVGLTQVLVWVILVPILLLITRLIMGIDLSTNMSMAQGATSDFNPDDMQAMVALAMKEFNQINWWLIVPLFMLFFLGGYFLYSSLFAAVGSAIGDDMGESSSLTLPITIPVILALYIMMQSVESPDSSLARWSSMFPLFSPIVMPARLAFNPPWWEVALSLTLLIGTAMFFVWISGRIYRVGILLYGKKAGMKELVKWVFMK
jgi:ABC-2 type transport system permease protein